MTASPPSGSWGSLGRLAKGWVGSRSSEEETEEEDVPGEAGRPLLQLLQLLPLQRMLSLLAGHCGFTVGCWPPAPDRQHEAWGGWMRPSRLRGMAAVNGSRRSHSLATGQQRARTARMNE